MGAIHQAVLRAMEAVSAQASVGDVVGAALEHAVAFSDAASGVLALRRGSELSAVAQTRPGGANGDAKAGDRVVLLSGTPLIEVAGIPGQRIAEAASAGSDEVFDMVFGTGDDGEPVLRPRAVCVVGEQPGEGTGGLAAVFYLENQESGLSPQAHGAVRGLAVQVAVAVGRIERIAALEAEATRSRSDIAAAEARAEAARDDLDDLAHWVAHDLRTPLTSIMGFSQILLDDWSQLPPREIETLLLTIDSSSMKMAHIIEELTVFVRLHKGEVKRSALDMGEIVGQTQVRLSNVIRRHEAEVVVASSFPTALGYRPWIEAVWSTLIRSGLQYGGDRPELELGARALDDGSVRYWVRDKGPGFSAEDKEDLFVPFRRKSKARIKTQGMGLALVRQVIERLDGVVGVDSTPGQGSTYYFTLQAA